MVKRIFSMVLMILGLVLTGRGDSVFVFEGTVEIADPALAPLVRNGQVLAGQFTVFRERLPEVMEGEGLARTFSGHLGEAAFTLDVDFRILLEAVAREGQGRVDVRPGDRRDQRDDVVAVLLPVSSVQTDSGGWQALWLELWFYARPGAMLRDNSMPDMDLAMDSAWFRIAFGHAEDDRWLYAEGPLTAYGPEGEPLSAEQALEFWQSAVDQLHVRLDQVERERDSLRREVQAARDRISALHQTVDTLIVEKQYLQRELSELRAHQRMDDETLAEERARWEVEQALLASANEQLRSTNIGLAEALVDVERESRALRRRIVEMEDRLAGVDPLPLRPDGLLQQGTVITEAQPLETRIGPAQPVMQAAPETEDTTARTHIQRLGSRRR